MSDSELSGEFREPAINIPTVAYPAVANAELPTTNNRSSKA